MKTGDIHKQLVKITADDKTKEAILYIIDNKIDDEMNTFTHKLDNLKNEISTLKWLIGVGFTLFSIIIALK